MNKLFPFLFGFLSICASAFSQQVATPSFSPSGGQSYLEFDVQVSCATQGAEIHYSLTGADPDISSPLILSGSSVHIDHGVTLKAKAWKAGLTDSLVAAAIYEVTGTVAVGAEHTVVLRSDGTVWTWGKNLEGQLGLGHSTNTFTPTQIPNLSGVVAIASGDYHNLALKSDNTVWAWGKI